MESDVKSNKDGTKTLISKWSNEDTRIMPINELCIASPIEEHHVQEQVIQSIIRDGLLEPLAVAFISKREWEKDMDGLYGPPYSKYEDKFYRVQMGNNRLRAAIDLGYYYISCNVFSSVQEAITFGIQSKKRGRKQSWRK